MVRGERDVAGNISQSVGAIEHKLVAGDDCHAEPRYRRMAGAVRQPRIEKYRHLTRRHRPH